MKSEEGVPLADQGQIEQLRGNIVNSNQQESDIGPLRKSPEEVLEFPEPKSRFLHIGSTITETTSNGVTSGRIISSTSRIVSSWTFPMR